MGLINHPFRAQVVALKFRNHILNVSDNRLEKQMYMALRSDSRGLNRSPNGVRNYMDPLATQVDWWSPKSRYEAKNDAHELLCSFQRKFFASAKNESSSVMALAAWTFTDRTAPYLLRKTFSSSSLMEGRRLKAMLRLGCGTIQKYHDSASSKTRFGTPTLRVICALGVII
jgi:hypothetical protein